MDAFFFKFSILSWKILGAISQSTYFAVSYSGSLDRILDRIKLSDASATYCRKVAVVYTSIAWVMLVANIAFTLYSLFFTVSHMDVILAPITTHVSLSDLLVPRIALFLCGFHLSAAWVFPHAMSFMLATIFSHQYKVLGRMLTESDQGRLSDSDIETFRQRHQKISMSVSDTDDFLMFHNAGAFCCQLFDGIMNLYDLIFFRTTNDPVVILMRAFQLLGVFFGLSVTTAGGIMVNHYVSTNGNYRSHISWMRTAIVYDCNNLLFGRPYYRSRLCYTKSSVCLSVVCL